MRVCPAPAGILLATFLAVPGVARAGAQLTVRAEPAGVLLTAGDSPTVALIIEAREDGGGPRAGAQIVVDSTAGTVRDVRRVEAGRYEATLEPPAERFPQLAVITALEVSPVVRGEPPLVANTIVSYSARIELQGRGEPRARMRIEIGSQGYGPAEVGDDGRFVVPVVVPPGVGWATGIATDELGNTSRSRINLFLPEVRRLHASVYPDTLIADGNDRGWVFVQTVDGKGEPADVPVRVQGARGTVGRAERIAAGLARFSYRAPVQLGDRTDRVELSLSRGKETAEVPVKLMAGAPATVDVQPVPSSVQADGVSSIRVDVEVTDANGNPASGHDVRVQMGGTMVRAAPAEPGAYQAELPPRTQVFDGSIPVAVIPRSAGCPRPWAAKAPDGTFRVRDARGILCQLEFAVVDGRGAVLFQGSTSDMGELRLPAEYPPWESRLMLVGASGGAPDVLWVGREEVHEPVAILHSEARAVWRVPTPGEVGLRLVKRGADGAVLALEVAGLETAAARERIRVSTSAGQATLATGPGGDLLVSVSGVGAGAQGFDVIATDEATGVSAWVRVE